MNNIHEKDWADEIWHGHTGMDCSSGYCFLDKESEDQPPPESTVAAEISKNTGGEEKS